MLTQTTHYSKSECNDDFLAGPEGIEPSLTVLETVVLPLNYGPTVDD